MDSLNELFLEQGYRIYMCSVDRRYVSFVQEESHCINVICIYDERSQTSTRAQLESFLRVHRERLSYGRDMDIHFLRIVCTTEHGVGYMQPMSDQPALDASWINDVWYLIDDAYQKNWRLFVPQTAAQDYYGLRGRLERYVAEHGVRIALPEISEELAAQTRAAIDRIPMQTDAARRRIRAAAAPASAAAPWVTVALILINVIMYFMEEGRVFDVDDYVVATGILADSGQWYRLLTSMFLHGSIEHLINNMLVLYAVGSYMEPRFGRFIHTTVYLLSGIAGGIFSVWYHTVHSDVYQALGASGAIYGLIGGMVAYMLLHREFQSRQYYYRMGLALLLLFYSSRTDVGIDMYAHIGGFVAGLVLAGILCIVMWTGVRRRERA